MSFLSLKYVVINIYLQKYSFLVHSKFSIILNSLIEECAEWGGADAESVNRTLESESLMRKKFIRRLL
jgi:hypothetical protein